MRYIGYGIFIFGISIGSLFAARPQINWIHLIGCVTLSLVGVILIRYGSTTDIHRGRGKEEHFDIKERFSSILNAVEDLWNQWDRLSIDQRKDRIEHILGQIATFADKRSEIVSKIGHRRFSELFVPRAQGERNLNRTWSSLVDGNEKEAKDSLSSVIAVWKRSLNLN